MRRILLFLVNQIDHSWFRFPPAFLIAVTAVALSAMLDPGEVVWRWVAMLSFTALFALVVYFDIYPKGYSEMTRMERDKIRRWSPERWEVYSRPGLKTPSIVFVFLILTAWAVFLNYIS